jgi:hypothetical protein
MSTTATSAPPDGVRVWKARGFSRLVLTEGKIWFRGGDPF